MSVFMKRAIELAIKAEAEGEVPVGAVIVKDGDIIAEGYNQTERLKDATAHAEMLAIKRASEALDSRYLDGCELYVTLEPCPMCAGGIINSRIKRVYFGAYEPKFGSCSHDSVVNLFSLPYNHKPEVYGGIEEKETAELLSRFFKEKRKKNKE